MAVEQAFQPATPTFLSARAGEDARPDLTDVGSFGDSHSLTHATPIRSRARKQAVWRHWPDLMKICARSRQCLPEVLLQSEPDLLPPRQPPCQAVLREARVSWEQLFSERPS